MLLILHQFAVSKMDEKFSKEDACEISKKVLKKVLMMRV